MKALMIEVALTTSAFMIAILTFFQSAVAILLGVLCHGALSVNVNQILLYSLVRAILPGLILGVLITAYVILTSKRSE